MLVLALACVVIGVVPWVALPPAARVAGLVAGMPPEAVTQLTAAALDGARRITTIAVLLLGLGGAATLARAFALRRAGTAVDQTWACGYATPTARTQYSASSFAAPLIGLFGPLAGVAVHRAATGFATHPANLVLDRVLAPMWRGLRKAGGRLRPIQQGRLQLYLLYIVATVSALLLYLVASGGGR